MEDCVVLLVELAANSTLQVCLSRLVAPIDDVDEDRREGHVHGELEVQEAKVINIIVDEAGYRELVHRTYC
jgi:hypothetical protein